MQNCKACEEIAFLQREAERVVSKIKMKHVIRATITQETYVNGRFTGRLNIKGPRMRFCPECGRKLKRQETIYDSKGDSNANSN